MRELTYEEFCASPLTYTIGTSSDLGVRRLYRNEQLGIQKEVFTKRKRAGDFYSGWREAKVHLFLDGVEGEHANMACLYEAWMARVCGVLTVTDIGGKQ